MQPLFRNTKSSPMKTLSTLRQKTFNGKKLYLRDPFFSIAEIFRNTKKVSLRNSSWPRNVSQFFCYHLYGSPRLLHTVNGQRQKHQRLQELQNAALLILLCDTMRQKLSDVYWWYPPKPYQSFVAEQMRSVRFHRLSACFRFSKQANSQFKRWSVF